MSTKQETCEERISAHLASRIAHIDAAYRVANGQPYDFREDVIAGLDLDAESPTIEDDARESLWELPLGVSSRTVHRIDLSTGGPGDWFEVWADENNDIDRISYHFNDWFDHAERWLEDEELATAEAFAREVVAALAE